MKNNNQNVFQIDFNYLKGKIPKIIIIRKICIFTNKNINTDAISSSERMGDRYKLEFCWNRIWKRLALNKNNTKKTDKIKTIVLTDIKDS